MRFSTVALTACLFCGVKVIMDRGRGLLGRYCDVGVRQARFRNERYVKVQTVLTLPVLAIGAVFTILFSIAHILHVPVAVIRASGAVPITPVVVALTATTVVLAWRVVTRTARWGAARATRARGAIASSAATWSATVGTRIETPGGGGWRASPLQRRSAGDGFRAG